MKPQSPFATLAARLLDLVFPRDCAVTGEPVADAPWRYLSAAGRDLLTPIVGACCPVCGSPFHGLAAPEQTCEHCARLRPVFSHGKVAVIAGGAGRHLVHQLKYHRSLWLAEDMARVMAETPGFPEFLANAVIVPVPLHPRRQRWRGFNQARALAEHLAELLPERGRPAVRMLLERRRDTPTQTHLNRGERAKNMRNAFALAPDAKVAPGERHIVMDDVFTTGATLNACATVLLDAGAGTVDIAAFARAI
ncbi:MAG: ComF family protein [Puniceicoccales bacterium]|nr:ComF family protein [Puniceicoccales bacterium]